MNTSVFNLPTLLGLLLTVSVRAQPVNPHRFEVELGGGALRLPSPYRSGYVFRQQLTGYVSPRVGVALGLNWGSSANFAALGTRNPADPQGRENQPDPAQLGSLYQRTEQMTDLSLVALPVLTRRHQVKVQVGLSAYRRRETGVDTIIYPEPRFPYYEIIPRQTSTLRFVPTVGAGYDFRLSNRWAVGVNGAAYFTGASAPTTTFGLRGTYRFGLIADSLGFAPIRWNEVTWGVRAAGSVVGQNGRSVNLQYRLRFNGGLWAELPLSLTWAMRGEINYAQRGFRAREVRVGSGVRYLAGSGDANYLELPLLFRHEVAYRWHLYGGPYLAFFLNGYSRFDSVPEEPIPAHTVSGLMLGTTHQFTDRLAADLRYQRDLITLSTTPYGGFHSFQLGLTYQIGKKP